MGPTFEKYPDIGVVATSAEPKGGDTVDVRADLTFKGHTAPMPLRANLQVLDEARSGSPRRPPSTMSESLRWNSDPQS